MHGRWLRVRFLLLLLLLWMLLLLWVWVWVRVRRRVCARRRLLCRACPAAALLTDAASMSCRLCAAPCLPLTCSTCLTTATVRAQRRPRRALVQPRHGPGGQSKCQLLHPATPHYPFPRGKFHTRGNMWGFTVS